MVGSLSLSIKMNTLLYMPGFSLILLYSVGWIKSIQLAIFFILIQGLLGLPFLITFPKQYLAKSFEFGRVFMFQWTVNWRFLGESVFLSEYFSKGLLMAHVGLLTVFLVKWMRYIEN
jgi:alpha-1,3-mannosyltransferase